MKKDKVRVRRNMQAEDLIVMLEGISDCLKKGTLCIESGEHFATLNPSGNIDFKLEAVQKKNKEKLTIEMGWRQFVPTEKSEADALRISKREPERIMAEAEEAFENVQEDAAKAASVPEIAVSEAREAAENVQEEIADAAQEVETAVTETEKVAEAAA